MTFLVIGCRSIDINKQTAEKRDALAQKEAWRNEIPAQEQEPLRPIFPEVTKKVLGNGLTIMVVEDHRLPIAEVSLVLKNGSASDPYGLAGLNHLTAAMLKEGTKSKTALELAEAFSNLGTEVSISVSKDMTQISAAILSSKIDETVGLIADMTRYPRMSDTDFARIKLQHQSTLAAHQGVLAYVAQVSFLEAAYGEKHPYAYPSSGTTSTVTKVTLNDIKKAHQEYFGANNAALIAVGDITLAELEALARKNFGSWKKAPKSLTKIPDPKPSKQMLVKLVARSNSPQTFLLLGQAVANQKDPDLAVMEVFQSIIAGLPTSRLDANLREKKGWTYGVQSSVTPLLGKGPMIVGTSIQVPFGADALNEIMTEFENLKKEPVTDAELQTAKNGLLHSFASRYSTIDKVLGSVADQFVYSLAKNNDEKLYEKIGNVTKKDLQTIANRILKRENMVAVAVGDLETMETPVTKMNMGKVIIERESKPAQP